MTSKKPLSSWKPTSFAISTPSPNLLMATLKMADALTSPSPVATDSPTRPSGSRSLTMAASPAIQRRTALTTSPMSVRSMWPPSIQLTLQSLYPIGSMRPFKGQPLATLPSLMQSRAWMIGGSRPMLCDIEISTSASSTTRPSSTAPTASSRAPSLPKTNAGVGLSVRKFQNGFHIWRGSPCRCPPINVLEEDGRKDRDVTSKGEHDVIDLTNKSSSDNDEEQ